MSMCRSTFALGGLIAALTLTASLPLRAAELAVHAHHGVVRAADCGPCGCLTVRYVYHRYVGSTYGAGFDPRDYDTTEPHFYLGPVRAYPRYFVNGIPVPFGRICHY